MRSIFNFLVFRVWMVFHDRSSRWRNALFPAANSAAFNFWRSKISIFDSHQKLAWILTKMSLAADKQSSCSSRPDTCLTSTCCTLQPKFLWGLHLNSTKRIACVREQQQVVEFLTLSTSAPCWEDPKCSLLRAPGSFSYTGETQTQSMFRADNSRPHSWHPGFIARQSLDRKTLSILPKTSTVHTVLRVFFVLDHISGI